MKLKNMSPISLIMLGVFAGGLFALNFNPNCVTKMFAEEQIGAANAPVAISLMAKELNKAFVSVSEAVLPTVVSISVKIESKPISSGSWGGFEEFFMNPFGGKNNESYQREASGSGVIISANGYIITNNHVVEDASEIKVTTSDKKTYKAKLIGNDPMTDLAVIKIEAEKLPVVHFADMKDVKIGEMVLALGNPLGLNSTITQGIISAIGRGQLSMNRRADKQIIENFIQTDAAINPGNSGGGLYDLTGSLVGINTAIATQTGTYMGYGFAIPVDLVKNVAEDLIEDGKVDRGYIGVQMEAVNEAMAKAQGMSKIYGVTVQGITKKSPAERAGIEVGDIIIEIDGKEILSTNELQGYVFSHRVGDKLNLTLLHNGKKITKTVELEALDSDIDLSDSSTGTSSWTEKDVETDAYEAKIASLGITVEKMTSSKKDEADVDNGVMVSKVERNSEAYLSGIGIGTVIIKADRTKIDSPYDLMRIVKQKSPGDAILLQVKYNNTNRMIAIIIPEPKN